MKQQLGIHSQSWCQGRFTHRLCNGYRFDTQRTLRDIGVDVSSIEGKIEILCSCSCHDRVMMANGDPQKFGVAFRTTVSIFGTAARDCDEQSEISYEVIGLGAYLTIETSRVCDFILDSIDLDRSFGPGVGLPVFGQAYILFLHLAQRIAFGSAGPRGRDLLMDQLEPIIFEGFAAYLEKRYNQDKKAPMPDELISALVELQKELFSESLYLAELGYSKLNNYELIKNHFGELVIISLTECEVELGSNFKSIAIQALEDKGNRLRARVEAVIG